MILPHDTISNIYDDLTLVVNLEVLNGDVQVAQELLYGRVYNKVNGSLVSTFIHFPYSHRSV